MASSQGEIGYQMKVVGNNLACVKHSLTRALALISRDADTATHLSLCLIAVNEAIRTLEAARDAAKGEAL